MSGIFRGREFQVLGEDTQKNWTGKRRFNTGETARWQL